MKKNSIPWFVSIYTVTSFILAIATMIYAGIIPAFCLFGTSIISLTATAGLKYAIVSGDKRQKVVIPIVVILLLIFAYWLSSGFSIHIFGFYVSGLVWGTVGAVFGIFIPASSGDKWPSQA